MVHQHPPGRFVEWERFPHLLRDPLPRWVVGGAAGDELASGVIDDVEDIKRSGPPVKCYLKIHGAHCVAMVVEEGFPALVTGRVWFSCLVAFQHITHGRLRNRDVHLLAYQSGYALRAVALIVCLDVEDDLLN